MKKIFLFVFMLAFTSFAQRAGNPDEWVESGQMLRYPASRYFSAVGMGTSEVAARENAIVEVRRQISASIDSRTLSVETHTSVNNRTVTSSHLDQNTVMTIVGDIEGVQIIATATRQNNFFAFAALEKERFVSHQRMKINELRSDLTRTNTQANTALSAHNVALAVSLFNSMFDKISAMEVERTLLSAATALTANEEIPVSRAEINTKLTQLFSSIRITASGQNRQVSFIGEAPNEPFAVAITANGRAVENMQVSLFNENDRKVATASSDRDGIARLALTSNIPTTRGTYRFTARIDLEGAQNIAEVPFTLSARTRDISGLISFVFSPELRSGATTIQQAANEALSNHGILNDDCGCIKISVVISDVLGETIKGVSAARTFVRSTASMQISFTDKNGKQLYSTTVSQLGVANNRVAAVADGIKKMRMSDDLPGIQNALQAQAVLQSVFDEEENCCR
jgi:hypothetical protein